MGFFISDAMAANGAAEPNFNGFIMIGIFVLLFYFMLIRPQSKRAKEHKQMVEALAKGDEVVTNGGILGKITEVEENFISVEVSSNVVVKVQRQAVSALVPKGTIKQG